MINNTICNNTSKGKGGGIAFINAVPVIYNTIVYGNSADLGGNEIHLESVNLSPDFFHCLIKDPPALYSGEEFVGQYVDCLETDPGFVDPSDGSGPGYDGLQADWGLTGLSPCINVGTSDGIQLYIPDKDNRGNKRIKYGEIDIGAIEYQKNYVEISGNIIADAVWFADTIRVTDDIIIESGKTLQILPGTTVEFAGHYNIEVEGTLLAIGTQDEEIKFTTGDTTGFTDLDTTSGGWGGISFDGTPNTNDTSKFIHCIFEYGKGVYAGSIHGNGGAIYANKYSKIFVDNCLFRQNIAGNGGAIYCNNSSIIIRNSQFLNNLAGDDQKGQTTGGAISLWESSAILENCMIANNSAEDYGGGIAVINAYSDPWIVNCIIANNSCGSGGGVYFSGNGTLIHNTITNNSTIGIRIDGNARIINTIIWGNERQFTLGSNKEVDFLNCNVQDGADQYAPYSLGTFKNNMDEDPRFVSPAVGIGPAFPGWDADWSPDNFSACIDKGTIDISGVPAMDIYGNSRINNSIPDIGAVENTASRLIVENHPEDQIACEDENIIFYVGVSDTAKYQWRKDLVDIPGKNGPSLSLDSISVSDQGVYKCLVSNAYGVVESQSAYLIVNALPEILVEPKSQWVKGDKDFRLNCFARGSNLDIHWITDDSTSTGQNTTELYFENIGYDDEGSYRCIISNSCGSDTSRAAFVYVAPQICMVTVDPSTGNNLIVWEKNSSAPISYYKIYRESNYAGIFDELAAVPHDDLSVILDKTADPASRAYIYKITAVNTTEFETDIDLSNPHKTIHLLVTANPETKATQLDWDRYVGFDYGTYLIYRSDTTYDFSELDQMSSSTSTWSDPDPGARTNYYRIAALKPDACFPSGNPTGKADSGPYSHAMSNIENNRLQGTGVRVDRDAIPVQIFPNPFNQSTTIRFSNPGGETYTLYITDLSGKVCRIEKDITTSGVLLEKGDLKKGLYLLELRGPVIFRDKIIIE